MRFYPSRRRVIRDLYPAMLLMIFGICLGASNLTGSLEPRGAFANFMARGATVTAPFALYELLKPFWKPAAVVDAKGVFWATSNEIETGFVPRHDIADVRIERIKGVSTLRLFLTTQEVLEVPIRTSRPIGESLAGVRTTLGFG